MVRLVSAGETGDSTAADLLDEAYGRFLHDAEFHAQVETAVQVVEHEWGKRLTESQRAAAYRSAAVALVVAPKNASCEADQ